MSRLLKLSSLWARDPSGRAWKTPAWALPGPPLSVTMQRPSPARFSATRVQCRADLAPRVRAAGPRAVQPAAFPSGVSVSDSHHGRRAFKRTAAT